MTNNDALIPALVQQRSISAALAAKAWSHYLPVPTDLVGRLLGLRAPSV